MSAQERHMLSIGGICFFVMLGFTFILFALSGTGKGSLLNYSVTMGVLGGLFIIVGLSWTFVLLYLEEFRHNRNG